MENSEMFDCPKARIPITQPGPNFPVARCLERLRELDEATDWIRLESGCYDEEQNMCPVGSRNLWASLGG